MEMIRDAFPPGQFLLSKNLQHWDWEKVTTGRCLGVGLVRFDEHPLHPAVVVSLQTDKKHKLPLGSIGPFHDTDDVSRALREVSFTVADDYFNKDTANKISIIGMPSPRLLSLPGLEARCGATPGTYGARILINDSRHGILTAGHVAPNEGAPAYEGPRLIGTVSATRHSKITAPGTPTADIAIIELLQQVNTHPKEQFFPEGTGEDGDLVKSYGAVTTGRTSKIEMILPAFGDPQEETGVLGNVMLTTEAISTFGDSGAIAVQEPQARIIGHVVAGVPATSDYEGYSVIQDLRYQLNQFSARLTE